MAIFTIYIYISMAIFIYLYISMIFTDRPPNNHGVGTDHDRRVAEYPTPESVEK